MTYRDFVLDQTGNILAQCDNRFHIFLKLHLPVVVPSA